MTASGVGVGLVTAGGARRRESRYSMTLDGVDEYVTMEDVLGFEYTSPRSISFWYKSTDANAYFVSKLAGSTTFRGFGIALSSGQISWTLSNDIGGSLYTQIITTAATFADGVWHHVVVTYSAATPSDASDMAIYIDSALEPTTVNSNTLGANTIITTTHFNLGSRTNGQVPLAGSMDDVAVYDKELSTAEVDELFNRGKPIDARLLSSAQALVGYWTCGDGDTHPNLRDRSVATPASNTGASIIDRSQNVNDGTPTNMEAGDFRPYLLAAETMPDLSGNGNAGTPTNMEDADFTTDVPGGRGHSWYSMTLDGVNEYVSLGNVHAFDRTSPFSLSIWVKTTHVAGNHFALAKANAGAPEGYHILVGSTGVVVFGLINTFSGNDMRVTTTTTVNDGSWHHIVATWDGDVSGGASGAHIYIDGVDETLVVQADTLVSTIVSTADLRIGTRELGFPAESWNGQLDEVSIYDKELSQTEVQAIYNSGVPVDNRTLSTAPNLVGYWGCGDAGPGGVLRQVANLDGVDEYVTLGNVATLDFERTSTFTWTFWFKTTATSGYLVSKQENAVPTGWAIGLTGSGGLFFEMIYNFGLGDRFRIDTDNAYNDDTWHHGAVSFSGNGSTSGATFYIDGAAVAATSVIDALGNNIANNAAVQFGDRELDQGTTPFAGQLAAFTAHDKVLSLTEVQALYNSGRSTDPTLLNTEPNLVGGWFMSAANDGTMTNTESTDIVRDSPLL